LPLQHRCAVHVSQKISLTDGALRAATCNAYMRQLKEDLPPFEYKALIATLQQFRRGTLGVNAVVDRVVESLRQPGRHHLLGGFEQFLPQDTLAQFRAKYGGSLLYASQGGESSQDLLPAQTLSMLKDDRSALPGRLPRSRQGLDC